MQESPYHSPLTLTNGFRIETSNQGLRETTQSSEARHQDERRHKVGFYRSECQSMLVDGYRISEIATKIETPFIIVSRAKIDQNLSEIR